LINGGATALALGLAACALAVFASFVDWTRVLVVVVCIYCLQKRNRTMFEDLHQFDRCSCVMVWAAQNGRGGLKVACEVSRM
jgi:hypothetical protein